MTLDDFLQSLTATVPPLELSPALAGLWWEAKGDWTRAHESAQQAEGIDGAWVHAYLHRKEGDQGNAAYCMAGRASLSAENSSRQSGAASQKTCFEAASSSSLHKMTFSIVRVGALFNSGKCRHCVLTVSW